jgi:two-component system sensor histidine kinase UhpB
VSLFWRIFGLNAALLRWGLTPLGRLTRLMATVDLLRPGQRLPVPGAGGGGEVTELVRTFNAMLDRLEHERATSSARVLLAQEAERRRIAQELHDEVGQGMTAILLVLKRAADDAPEPLRGELHQAQEITRASLDEVRRLVRRLRPGVLDDLGLVSALTSLTQDFATHTGLRVVRRFATDLPVLDPETELVLYRVAQESLTNAARHADAARIEVALRRSGEAVTLEITDDGRGIEALCEGAGIRGMRDRPRPHLHARHRNPRPPHRPRLQEAALTMSEPTPAATPIRILLADDHALVRRGVRLILDREPDLEVVAEAGDGAEAIEAARSERVDLAVLDIAMPRLTGLQATRELAALKPGLRILMLTMHDNEQYLFQALKAGACGYVLKSVADRDLVAACRAAMRDEPFLYPGAVTALIRNYLDRVRHGEENADHILTPREEEVLKLVAEGHSSKEIAEVLFISVKTVHRHRANLLHKLGLRDRLELTRYAIRAGLIEP